MPARLRWPQPCQLCCCSWRPGCGICRASLGPWPLLLVGLAWLLWLVQTGSLFPRSAFDGPLALFLLTAAIGASISIDRTTAWSSTFYIYPGRGGDVLRGDW